MYTLKSIARRASLLGSAFALFVAAIIPAAPVFADALNPLTDRSLTLSSSSPGWDFLDGSGNALYAPPNSGANGQKTGNTFDFRVSTNSSPSGTNEPIQAMTFQYCTTSAGNCVAPGDNGCVTGTVVGNDCDRKTNAQARTANDKTSDLEIVAPSVDEIDNADFSSIIDTDDTDGTSGIAQRLPLRDSSEGTFIVYYDNAGTWTQSQGWTMTVDNQEIYNGGAGSEANGTATGTDNYIKLENSTGLGVPSGTQVKVVFFATDANYITNPGSGAFFVKINTYKDDSALTEANLIDGGVTVANVMNQSINIQTKVLETMDFSVGVVDPYTLESLPDDPGTTGVDEAETSQLFTANGEKRHGQCSRILKGMELANDDEPKNTLLMGDPNAEFSLRTDKTYSTHSYWRLSSNSSAGATVYYSGNTLANTVNDSITPIGTSPAQPSRGTEQFGLALANGTRAANPQPANLVGGTGLHLVNYDRERTGNNLFENGADNAAGAGVHASVATDITAQSLTNVYHTPRLWPLIPETAYDQGAGSNNGGAGEYGTVNTEYAFDNNSTYIPAALATQDDQVVDCVTGKMRYIANIAATTPAGIYTTKINYIAAPQY